MTNELTLRDYLDILRRRAWIVALCFLGALVLALLWSGLQTSLYQSSARVLINQAASTDIFDPTAGSTTNTTFADRQAATAVELIESQLVDAEAESRLEFEAEINASAASRADIVTLSAIDADPARARLVAQTYAEAYLDIQRREFTDERLATAEDLLTKIADLDLQIADLGSAEEATRQQALREDLADSYDRLVISASLGNSGTARIIDEAEIPENPVSPRTNRNVALGGILGLMIGAGAALLLESLDTSIKSRQVIEELAPGLPALALIPALKAENRVISADRLDSLETEVFRTLRASIEFASVDRPLQMIQITSAGASAGKTTIAANLALVMAQSGKRVAVIDCDLRRPRLHAAFNIEQVPGISSVIIGRTSGAEASHALNLDNGRLWVFPSGPIPPGPSELLGSERARATFASLRKSLDVIIIDSPPVLPVSDALVVSRFVDATVVVANAKSTKRVDLVRALEQLNQAGANVIGTVLNEVKANGNQGYGYGYGYGYGHADEAGFLGRRKNQAPRLEGTETFTNSDVPQFKAAHGSAGTNGSSSKTAATSTTPITDALGGTSWLEDAVEPASATATPATNGTSRERTQERRAASKAKKGSATSTKADKPSTDSTQPASKSEPKKRSDEASVPRVPRDDNTGDWDDDFIIS